MLLLSTLLSFALGMTYGHVVSSKILRKFSTPAGANSMAYSPLPAYSAPVTTTAVPQPLASDLTAAGEPLASDPTTAGKHKA